jgi:hypothetical protein
MSRTTALLIAISGTVVALFLQDYLALILFALIFMDAIRKEA